MCVCYLLLLARAWARCGLKRSDRTFQTPRLSVRLAPLADRADHDVTPRSDRDVNPPRSNHAVTLAGFATLELNSSAAVVKFVTAADGKEVYAHTTLNTRYEGTTGGI